MARYQNLYRINANGARIMLEARNETNNQVLSRICDDCFIGTGCSEQSAQIAVAELRRALGGVDDIDQAAEIEDLASKLETELERNATATQRLQVIR